MTITPGRRILVLFALAGVLIGGLLLVIFGWELPRLTNRREVIDNRRTTLAALVAQQSNLQALKQESDTIVADQIRLNSEVWSFANEEQFYSQLTKVAKDHAVIIDEPKVSEATPGDKPVIRTATIKLTGPAKDLFAALDQLQTITPLFSIQSVSLNREGVNSLTITGQTLWR